MARVVFIQDIAYEYFGVMYISANLKKHGHFCDVLIVNLESNWEKKLIELKPDLIAFSTLTGSFKWSIEKAMVIKKFLNKPVIFGGVHVYTNPASVIEHDVVDIVCTGEGEYPMVELCDKLDTGESLTTVNGFWFKTREGIIKGKPAMLAESLDDLPFADRSIFWKYPSIEHRGTFPMLGSRGCPYTCSYCFIPTARKIFKGQGTFIRERSPENILKEIQQCVDLSPRKEQVQFVDDHFGNNRDLYFQVLSSLSKINNGKLRWAGAIRIERFNREDYVKKLSQTHHGLLGIAVECGNEDYRKTVLKRDVKNDEILDAANLANKYGIKFTTLNMVALPGETYEMALETLDLNIQLQPVYANCYVFQPYPNNELSQYAIEHKFFEEVAIDKFGVSSYDRYDMNNPHFNKLVNLQRVFGLIVLFPRLKKPLLRLVETDARFLLDVCFGIYHISWLIRFLQFTPPQVAFLMITWFKSRFSWAKNPMKVSMQNGDGQLYAEVS